MTEENNKDDNELPEGVRIISTMKLYGGYVNTQYPVPSHLETAVLHYEYLKRALEYYLLSRYAYFHHMHFSFRMNSFWTVEYLLLSILVFDFDSVAELKAEFGDTHRISRYWKHIKKDLTEEPLLIMNRFDAYIDIVQSYYSDRYPKTTSERGQLEYTSTKKPKMTIDGKNKSNFGKVFTMNIDSLDRFCNFMFLQVTDFFNPSQLTSSLNSRNNTELYRRENKYSIIYPNQIYYGEK